MKKDNIFNIIDKKIPNKCKKYIPNIITSTRVLMALAFIGTFISGHMGLSVMLFASASISDAIDGYLARKWKVQSKFGKNLDPFADKLLVGSTLLLYGLKFNPLMFLPFIGELSIATVNIISVIKNKNGNVNRAGKIKTITLMSTTALALLSTLINSPVLSNIIQSLICINLPLQAGALSGYIDQLRKKDDEELNTELKLDINQEKSNKEDVKKNIKQQIEVLKNEKEFLSTIYVDKEKVKKIGQKSKET